MASLNTCRLFGGGQTAARLKARRAGRKGFRLPRAFLFLPDSSPKAVGSKGPRRKRRIMALQLILGNSGSGKSRLLYEKIIRASMENSGKHFLVIVPEQFTLETQKELVRLHPDHGILNIEILSFQRLAWRVFEETGASARRVLEETGKNLLLRKAAQDQEDRLRVLKGNMKKPGYITQLKSMISELIQYDISPEGVEELAEGQRENPSLYYKLMDVKLLYEAFEDRMAGSYITAEELLEELCRHVDESALLRDAVLAFDGFTGFTPIQNKLLRRLLPKAETVFVTVTVDGKEDFFTKGPMYELFYLSRKTIASLAGIAKDAGCRIMDPIVLDRSRFGRERASLDFLEDHLYRRGRRGRAVFSGTPGEISLHMARDPLEETSFAAREIWRLVTEENWHYGDIAVITGDLGQYANPARRIFGRYGIPCFIDETRKVLLNPALEYVKAALEVAKQNYTWESVVRMLRTGLAGVSAEETDLLENYLRAFGIRGRSRWTKSWERTSKTMDQETLAVCEALRVRIGELLLPFTEAIRKKGQTARQMAEILYRFLEAGRLQEQLLDWEKESEAAGRPEKAEEYGQIYGIIMELLDKIAVLLDEEPLTLEEFSQLLEAGFEEARAGMIPPETDRVLVGDIERTRLRNIRALFFLGLNDGLVPKGGKSGGFLTDGERSRLEKAGANLAPGTRENSYTQRFYLYQHLTKPTDRLYLVCGKTDGNGTPLRPSSLLNVICRMFPGLAWQDEDAWTDVSTRLVNPESGTGYLAASMEDLLGGNANEQAKGLFFWYRERKEYKGMVRALLEAASGARRKQGLGAQVAKALYGKNLENSVSRLEQYASCAYAHFLLYGLRLSEREEYQFKPVDMGNIFHKALELFAEKLQTEGYDWFHVPEEVRIRLTQESVREAADEYGGRILHSSARNEYAIGRILRITERTVWAFCEQIRRGSFVPANFEVPFSVTDLESVQLRFSKEESMRLRGRIDRIDVCDEGDTVYVKVIDYKSGNTQFDLVAVYYGLQLQLAVYLNAAVELEKRVYPKKEILPAGIFYYHIKDPMLEANVREDLAGLEERILKELRPDGLVNADPEVIRRMDRGMEKDSAVVPAAFNKDGSLSKTSKAASTKEFGILSSYVQRELHRLGREILEGRTEIAPYERDGATACDYCQFHEVCAFDPRTDKNGYRRLRKLPAEEIWKRMELETTRDGEKRADEQSRESGGEEDTSTHGS